MVVFTSRKCSFSRHANGRFHVTQMRRFCVTRKDRFCATRNGFLQKGQFCGTSRSRRCNRFSIAVAHGQSLTAADHASWLSLPVTQRFGASVTQARVGFFRENKLTPRRNFVLLLVTRRISVPVTQTRAAFLRENGRLCSNFDSAALQNGISPAPLAIPSRPLALLSAKKKCQCRELHASQFKPASASLPRCRPKIAAVLLCRIARGSCCLFETIAGGARFWPETRTRSIAKTVRFSPAPQSQC